MALHVALIEPQIPPNTGNIARLCAATDTPLHLIEPLGFSLDAREVKRAGLDYWDKVDLWVHPDWFAFRDAISRDRCLYFSANAERDYRRRRSAPNSVPGLRQRDRGDAGADPGEASGALLPHPDARRGAEPQPGERGQRGAVRGAPADGAPALRGRRAGSRERSPKIVPAALNSRRLDDSRGSSALTLYRGA